MKVGPFDVEVIGLREIVRKNKEEIEAEYKPSAALHAAQGRVQRWNVCVGALSVFAPTGELHPELDKNCSHGSKMATDENDVTVCALVT